MISQDPTIGCFSSKKRQDSVRLLWQLLQAKPPSFPSPHPLLLTWASTVETKHTAPSLDSEQLGVVGLMDHLIKPLAPTNGYSLP